VVRACLYDPDVSEVYAAFARHWASHCRPAHDTPWKTASPERSGGNVKSNALNGRRFDGLQALAEFLERWNRTVAQVRIHGTTRQQGRFSLSSCRARAVTALSMIRRHRVCPQFRRCRRSSMYRSHPHSHLSSSSANVE
jgi:hypothetical protein